MNIDPDTPLSGLTPPNDRLQDVMRLMQGRITPITGGDAAEARAITRLILNHLKGWDTTDLVIHSADTVSDYTLARIDDIIADMRKHIPIQYILGQARFYGMDLKVNPATLIPRHETEELVDLIISSEGDKKDLRVLDAGTGSGAIAIALSRNLRFPEVTAIDISQRALETARENAGRMHADINFLHCDIFDYSPESESFDIIVSNPPYVLESEKKEMEPEVLEHEPASALFVPDDDPLRFYRRISRIATDALTPGGSLYFEINPLCADSLVKMLEDMNFEEISLHKDISGRRRFCSARKHSL